MRQNRIARTFLRTFVLLGGASMLCACDSDVALEFRTVAGDGLQQGVTSIVNAVLDGIFAIVDPNTMTDGSA